MPSYMDTHEIPGGVKAEDVAKAHAHDVEVQGKYGVNYHKYWVDEKAGKIFCLCHAPNAEAAAQVHREAHGLVAENIIQVEPEVADLFMVGSEVKHTGDGIMASFFSAAAAVKCAARIQRDVASHRQEKKDRPIQLRIGVAAGEPVERHNDLFGCTVQLAARLCSQAKPEQILASSAVAELCVGKTLPFQEVGEVSLKGFDTPVRAHAVVWANEAASA